MSGENTFGIHNDFIGSCTIELGNLNEMRVVINNEKICVLFPFEQVCPDFLPQKFRQTRWYQWFKPLGLYFTTLCATLHHLLELFGKSWPPYGLSSMFTTFCYSPVSSVNSVQHFKSECCWYNNSAPSHQ